jgi:hypothetical protein
MNILTPTEISECLTGGPTAVARAIEKAVLQKLAGVRVEPVNNDLADDISAIDCIHRGDPSYEHDAYYMRKQAEKCVRHGYQLFTAEAIAAARVQALEEAAKVCDQVQWEHGQYTFSARMSAERIRNLK